MQFKTFFTMSHETTSIVGLPSTSELSQWICENDTGHLVVAGGSGPWTLLASYARDYI